MSTEKGLEKLPALIGWLEHGVKTYMIPIPFL
ncbi:MAG: hypothetical protein ACI92N_001457 [Pseudomonadales bacterium]